MEIFVVYSQYYPVICLEKLRGGGGGKYEKPRQS
jgi:hypothetical protein